MDESISRPVDLRLVPLAVALWATEAFVILVVAGRWVRPALLTTALAAVAGIGLWLLAWRRASHRPRSPSRSRRSGMTAPVVLGVGAGLVLAIMRVAPVAAEPLASMGAAHASADVVVVVDEPPRVTRKQPAAAAWSSGEGQLPKKTWSARATVAEISEGDSHWRLSVPIQLFGSSSPAELASLIPGTVISVKASIRPGDVARGSAAIVRVRGSPRQVATAPMWQQAAAHVRASMRAASAGLPADAQGLLPGLVVGDESRLEADLRADMQLTGLSHLTAVSGANLAIVTGLAIAVSRWFRVPRRLGVGFAVAALLGFVVVVGPQPSVLRAAVMGLVGLMAIFTTTDRAGATALVVSVVALLLIDPWLSLSMGFALSVAATAGLLIFAASQRRRRESDERPTSRVGKFKRVVSLAFGIACAAQLATLPLTASFGNGIPAVGIVANVLTEPAVPVATVFGSLAAVAQSVAPPAGQIPAFLGGIAAQWIAGVARWSADLPFAVLPWPPGLLGFTLAAALSAGVAASMINFTRIQWFVRAHQRASAAIVAALLGILVCLRNQQQPWPPPNWLVVACDVGQGDALVFSTTPGHAVVVDVGPDRGQVDKCLSDLGIISIDLLVLSHFHADHVDGVAGALNDRTVGSAMVSPLAEPKQQAEQTASALREHRVPVRIAAPGEQGRVGWLEYRVLWPTQLIRGPGSAPNNASVALAVEVGSPPVRVLLTGDLEPAAQSAVIAQNASTVFDLVKVPHHGSRNQSAELTRQFPASVAVVSVGAKNRYGHPAVSTIESWQRAGARVLRTDQAGDIAVGRDGTNQLFLVGRGPQSGKP